MGPLISIIITAFNIKEYIEKCIRSVLEQTYENIEIIIIDDGSSDGTEKICDEYSKTDFRIVVKHKKNEGVAQARNDGLALAAGDYITFVDGDDYVNSRYVELLYDCHMRTKADMTVCKYMTVFSGESIPEPTINNTYHTVDSHEALRQLLSLDLEPRAWGKLYKKELFSNIEYPKGKIYEDLAVVFQIIDNCGLIAIYEAELYYYFQRKGSIMNSPFNVKQFDEIEIIEKEMEGVKQRHPELEIEIKNRKVYSYLFVLERLVNSNCLQDFKKEMDVLTKKIEDNSHGLLLNNKIKAKHKLKLLSFYCGLPAFKIMHKTIRLCREQNGWGR